MNNLAFLLTTIDHYDLQAWIFNLLVLIVILLMIPYIKQLVKLKGGETDVKPKKDKSSKGVAK